MRTLGIEYPEVGKMHFCDIGEPGELGPYDILMETQYSGITNGTERHALLFEHGFGIFPGRHGYQQVGIVKAASEKAEGFQAGDWVYFGRYVGHRGWNIQSVHGACDDSNDSHLTIKLPDTVNRKHCALLGVAGVAMRGIRRLRVSAGQNIWVAGGGLIGQFSAQCARAVGARVTVTDINNKRLQIAQELGADRVENVRSKRVECLKDEGPYDCIIDCCGVESLLMDIHDHDLLAHRGIIGCMAVRPKVSFMWGMLHGREASIEVSCHYSLNDLRILLHLMEKDVVRIAPLITHEVSIDEAPKIYKLLHDSPGEMLGVVFDWAE